MTNREKYGEEILDILESGNNFTVTKDGAIGKCNPLGKSCNTCLFATAKYESECREQKGFWLKRKYVEKPKITENEIGALTLIDPIFKYIARDADKKIYLFSEKPKKGADIWKNTISGKYANATSVFSKRFLPMVKWEDEEPWKIENLLKLEVEGQ